MQRITTEHFDFLKKIAENNNRPWFMENKPWFDKVYAEIKTFFREVYEEIQKTDSIEKFQVHRIYRNLMFSKDKTPYKTHFRLYLKRTKPLLRGGYYLSIQPGKSGVSGGFWDPNSEDLLRIRKEIARDDSGLRAILDNPDCRKLFGGKLLGEELKTAPAGFDRHHPAIDLLRKKQFVLHRDFTDEEVQRPDFQKEVIKSFLAFRPFFDYMSEILTTDENGESLYR